MPQSSPYQPILLRILHGSAAILAISALISGFWVYNTYDKRWGSLPLPAIGDIQGIHGTIALTFFVLLPFFALYSFRIGNHRLIQSESFRQLTQLNTRSGWIAWHRVANTLMLLAATFAVITGRMMKEEWLPAGDLQRQWYQAHLVAWFCLGISLALHLLLGVKVGGLPLLRSMMSWVVRRGDTLRVSWQSIKTQPLSWIVKIMETVAIGGIVAAWILPLFNF
jgi:hypothetical protein